MNENGRDHVELTRQGFEAFNRGEMEAVVEFLHPEVEIHASADVGEPGTYHGRDGFLEWNRIWMEAWDEFRVELEEIEEIDGENVLVHVTQSGRGRGSGLEVSQRVTYLFTVRDGYAARLHIYGRRADALAAIGS
jgi:ketosteroid isomerase-like protein